MQKLPIFFSPQKGSPKNLETISSHTESTDYTFKTQKSLSQDATKFFKNFSASQRLGGA
jgi:hypothetical protein